MNPQQTAPISTETPDPRNVGSIPITRSPSQKATPAGKPGKTWEIGAPYIINETDAPDWKQIVVCTHEDGRCRYLSVRNNRRWPHVMQLSERSTPLAAFGVSLWNSVGAIEGNQSADGFARYADGKPRRWQGHNECTMPLISEIPKSWRLDPKVAPKLIKWITANLPSVQRAKAMPETIALDARPAAWESKFDAHDAAWETKFVMPLAAFMKQRGVQHLRVDLSGDTVKYALIPLNEPVQIFELVDATDEERYYPLGVFFDLKTAQDEAQKHHPGLWEEIVDSERIVEIRARNVGTSGGDYAVLWRGEWFYDYDGRQWKLVEQQTGTLEKPLPITRA